MPPPMTPRRLDWALRTRGTAMASWPAQEREAALALLRRDGTARAVLADALARDDTASAHGAAAGCIADASADPVALARMQCGLQRCLLQLPPLPFGLRWGALVVSLAAGAYLGVTVAMSDAAPDSGDPFAAVQTAAIASNF